jgi:hypothetical protein
MKSTIFWIALLICFSIQANANDRFTYTFQDGSKLVYNYRSDGSETSNKLEFVTSELSVVMQEDELLERVLINGDYTDKFYAQSEIVTAAKNDSVIVVVFKNSPGHQRLSPVHTKNYGIAPNHISKNDYLVKSFVKSDGKWESYLSFYPQTLYGDTVDQVINGITIISKDDFRIHYNGTWQIVGTVFKEIDNRKKSFKEGGETLKEVKYDPEHRLLLGVSGDQKSYSKTFIWWSPHHKITCGMDFQAHLEAYVGKAAKLGIPLSDLEYFERLGPEEQIDPLEKLLNERLEK